jgi:hypothetical protein
MDFVIGDVVVSLLGGLLCISGISKDEKYNAASEFTNFIKKGWASVGESSMDDGEGSLFAYFRG